MTASVATLCRHPLKGMGEERIEAVSLTAGQPMPWERVWAITHGAAVWDDSALAWQSCRNFVRQTELPRLAQIVLSFDEASERLHLSHPDLGEISIDPAAQGAALCTWLAPLAEGSVRAGPFHLRRVPGVSFTDVEQAHISLASTASLRSLEEMAGQSLDLTRFRMNVWIDGLAPWEELDWVGRKIRIGEAEIEIFARDERCSATTANPETGRRDVQVPALLRDRFGHMDFGVYASVTGSGSVRTGDPVVL